MFQFTVIKTGPIPQNNYSTVKLVFPAYTLKKNILPQDGWVMGDVAYKLGILTVGLL